MEIDIDVVEDLPPFFNDDVLPQGPIYSGPINQDVVEDTLLWFTEDPEITFNPPQQDVVDFITFDEPDLNVHGNINLTATETVFFVDAPIFHNATPKLSATETFTVTNETVGIQQLINWTHPVSFADHLVFTESVEVSRYKSVTESIAFIETWDYENSRTSKSATEIITFAESVTVDYAIPVADAISFSEAVCYCLTTTIPVSDSVTFVEAVNYYFLNGNNYFNNPYLPAPLGNTNNWRFRTIYEEDSSDFLAFDESLGLNINGINITLARYCCNVFVYSMEYWYRP